MFLNRCGRSLNVFLLAALTWLGARDSAVAQYYYPSQSYAYAQPVQYQAAYAPAASYQSPSSTQTVWRPVSVTSYETRYALDPGTGNYYAYLQPVTTTQWQAQQVAYTACRPIPVGTLNSVSTLQSGAGSTPPAYERTWQTPVASNDLLERKIATLQAVTHELEGRIENLETPGTTVLPQ